LVVRLFGAAPGMESPGYLTTKSLRDFRG
jgi:hypothetical protein